MPVSQPRNRRDSRDRVGPHEKVFTMQEMIDEIFALSTDVRYVALYEDGVLVSRERPGVAHPSGAESDRYEELLVNPTLLTLAGQRGAIDCGGLRFLVVRYGSFFQLVRPLPGGHLSVAVEPTGDPLAIAAALERRLAGR
jgi:hypothetical protein